jgi:hypothetical protein
MKTTIVLATAAVMFAAGGAFAQTGEMYVTKSGEKWMFHSSTSTAEGTEVLKAENGAKPANCPEGSYWLTDKQMLASCTGADELGFAKIEQGQKMASGEAYPAGSFKVQSGGQSMTDVSK